MEGVEGGVDGQDECKDEDVDDAVADDHLVHPVLLLFHDDHHRPRVEADREKKKGKSNPKEKGIRDLLKGSRNKKESKRGEEGLAETFF